MRRTWNSPTRRSSAFRLFALMFPALMVIMNFSTVAIMYFGGRRVASGAMQIGNLLAFITYVMQILISVLMATMLSAMIPRAAASGDRIQQVLDTEPTIHDPAVAVPAVSLDGGRRGRLEFKDVEFRYPGAQDPVLSHISFTARPGQTTAIVGSTGSGKTTLISLITRFYDVTGGSIEIDGRDIRTSTGMTSGNGSVWSPRRRSSSPAPWPATFAMGTRRPMKTRCGRPSLSRRPGVRCRDAGGTGL